MYMTAGVYGFPASDSWLVFPSFQYPRLNQPVVCVRHEVYIMCLTVMLLINVCLSGHVQDLALKHRAGLLHRPPPMHLQSSYQHDYGQKKAPVGAAPAKAPILEATRTLMRDGQGQASSAPSGAALQPFQAATEYQRNYQRWAQPAAPPPVSRSDLPTRREGNFLLEDISSDEEEDERHQHQQESHPTQLKYAKLDLPAQQARVPVQPAAGMPSSGPAGKQVLLLLLYFLIVGLVHEGSSVLSDVRKSRVVYGTRVICLATEHAAVIDP